MFSGCTFFVSIGPDDLKLNVGYDLVRDNAYVNFSVALDPKGTVIDYDRLTIKNPENFKLNKKNAYFINDNEKQTKKEPQDKVLRNAIVEEITDVEDDVDDSL